MSSSNAFRFEQFELHVDSFELYHQGDAVDLEPQELSVLACLVRHADTLVTKEDLLEEVWGTSMLPMRQLPRASKAFAGR